MLAHSMLPRNEGSKAVGNLNKQQTLIDIISNAKFYTVIVINLHSATYSASLLLLCLSLHPGTDIAFDSSSAGVIKWLGVLVMFASEDVRK